LTQKNARNNIDREPRPPMLRNYFEIISGKFPCSEIQLGYFRQASTEAEVILK